MNLLPLRWRPVVLGMAAGVAAGALWSAEPTATNRPDWLSRAATDSASSAAYSANPLMAPPPAQYRPNTFTPWTPLERRRSLVPDAWIASTNGARARLSNGKHIAWLDENSAVVVTNLPADPTLLFLTGRLYFRSRQEASTNLWVWLPGEPNALPVLGTDFHLRRDETTGGWCLTVIQGRVGNVGMTHALLRPGQVPRASLAGHAAIHTDWLELPEMRREIQWVLRYPAVVHTAEIPWPGDRVPGPLIGSLRAYEAGNLQAAWEHYEAARPLLPEDGEADPAVVLYRSNLLLGRGRVDEIEPALFSIASLPETNADEHRRRRLAYAILKVAAAVRAEAFPGPGLDQGGDLEPATASEWLAESYYQQSRIRRTVTNLHTGWADTLFCRPPSLALALAAAERAIAADVRGTNFWFGWLRQADVEFSHGNLEATGTALRTLLANGQTNAPTLTLQAFVLAARPKPSAQKAALAHFIRALETDPDYTDAWLGLGLLYLRGVERPERAGLPFSSATEAGLACLAQAALLEPGRSLVRSYLGKAEYDTGHPARAWREWDAAKSLDPCDPTPWLYSGLAKHQEYRVNEAARDLERSIQLNDHRAVYRSDLLLDQDRAVRGANLAAIYRDAGMMDVSVREASRALNYDYANGSAHLFLANSYDALRDPQQVNLRYETPWLNELLLANLLLPVGAGSLSQTISQQEYSRLFERDHLGIFSLTEYASRGDWLESGSVYLTDGPVSASFDAHYLSQNGSRPNADQQNLALWAKVKWQISPGDAVLLQALYADVESGDLAQYYDPASARLQYRLHETEEPIVLAGYHHQWAGAPAHRTLFLWSRLNNTQTQTDPDHAQTLVFKNPPLPGKVDPHFRPQGFQSDWDYRSRLNLYSTEVQHLWQQEPRGRWLDSGTLVAGGRFQFGEFATEDQLGHVRGWPLFPPALVPETPAGSEVSSDFNRYSAYLYENLGFADVAGAGDLLFTVGVCYDYLHYPVNHRESPVSGEEDHRDQVSPKAGVVWSLPWRGTLRGSYTRSLGGVSFDQTFRLEPSQVAGFLQSFRSLIPESVSGALAAPRFETWGAGYDQQLGRSLYLGLTGEWLESDADKVTGVFDSVLGEPVFVSSLNSALDYRERSAVADLTWLAGDEFSINARYRFSHAEYEETFGGAVLEVPPVENAAFLQEASFRVAYNQASPRLLGQHLLARHRFFSVFEGLWRSQSNVGYTPDLPGDEAWQFNVFAGLRFPRRAAELRVGVLNLTDEDYRFNPLNLMPDWPRDRTFVVSFQFNLERGL